MASDVRVASRASNPRSRGTRGSHTSGTTAMSRPARVAARIWGWVARSRRRWKAGRIHCRILSSDSHHTPGRRLPRYTSFAHTSARTATRGAVSNIQDAAALGGLEALPAGRELTRGGAGLTLATSRMTTHRVVDETSQQDETHTRHGLEWCATIPRPLLHGHGAESPWRLSA